MLWVDPSNRTSNYGRLSKFWKLIFIISIWLWSNKGTAILKLVTCSWRILKLMRKQRLILLKNTLECGVFEIRVNDICSVCSKKARPFIREVIHTLSQKWHRHKVSICKNIMDVLSGYRVRLEILRLSENVRSWFFCIIIAWKKSAGDQLWKSA